MLNKSLHILYKVSLIVLIIVPSLISCSPSRRLAPGEYLYNISRFDFEDEKIDPALLKKYERLAPNKRILGIRFHLFIYNLANPEKDKGLHKWLKEIGEAPVLFDSNLVKQNINNYSKFLSDVGYNNVTVSDSLIYRPKNSIDVIYNVNLGVPTTIGTLDYNFEDTSIQRYIYADTSNALIKQGMLFNKQLIQAERLRLENVLKDNGYFKFSKEYIYIYVSNSTPNTVSLKFEIKQNVSGIFNPLTRVRKHKQYNIGDVVFIPDIQNLESAETIDTVLYDQYKIIYFGNRIINPSTLVAASRVEPGRLYSQADIDKTYSNLSALGIFRFMNIRLSETEVDSTIGKLDCRIDLSMRKRQSYAAEFFITNSSGDFGVRGNLTYNNYNFFRGGEHFQAGISGAIESIKKRYKIDVEPMKEFGVFTRLETPKFLLPFSANRFQRKYSPRTAFQLSYNNQHQPKYIRTIANTSFGYIWRGSSFTRHSFYPVDFSLVKLPRMDQAYFDTTIRGKRLEYSFIDHTILSMRYVFEFNTQSKEQQKGYVYLRSTLESAGPLVSFVNKYSHWMPDSLDSLFFGVQYSQYLRGDIDFRFFHIITPSNKLAFRLYGGLGIPYGNSKAMPFEKMFWSGGPYGIRAWSERSLGPGSSQVPDSIRNQLGDIKLEGNIEYRFKLFWKLEGALFVDAGNVWMLKEGNRDPGEFDITKFHEDIAIGTGFGARFDLSFVLIRADLGFKVKDPARNQGEKWMFQNDNYMLKYSTFQFGIGYPF